MKAFISSNVIFHSLIWICRWASSSVLQYQFIFKKSSSIWKTVVDNIAFSVLCGTPNFFQNLTLWFSSLLCVPKWATFQTISSLPISNFECFVGFKSNVFVCLSVSFQINYPYYCDEKEYLYLENCQNHFHLFFIWIQIIFILGQVFILATQYWNTFFIIITFWIIFS